MLFDFFTYAAAQDQANIDVMNPGSFSDPFRESQLGAEAASLLVETKGWERARAAHYLNTTKWGHNHGNGALDLEEFHLLLHRVGVEFVGKPAH